MHYSGAEVIVESSVLSNIKKVLLVCMYVCVCMFIKYRYIRVYYTIQVLVEAMSGCLLVRYLGMEQGARDGGRGSPMGRRCRET